MGTAFLLRPEGDCGGHVRLDTNESQMLEYTWGSFAVPDKNVMRLFRQMAFWEGRLPVPPYGAVEVELDTPAAVLGVKLTSYIKIEIPIIYS